MLKCPECKSKNINVSITDYDCTGEEVLVDYIATCENCQTTFSITEEYSYRSSVAYYKGEEFYREGGAY